MSFLLEVLKISLPAFIVFLTAYFVLKSFLDKQYQLRVLELRQTQSATTLPLRLQAYERLSVLCERIAVPNLILRLRETGMTAHQLKIALLVAIQHEFEYNISQQVYVSESLWQILKAARDYTVNKISYIADGIDPQANASELAVALLNDAEENASALDKALLAIKSEAAGFM